MSFRDTQIKYWLGLPSCITLYKDENVETYHNDEQDQTVIHFLQEETIQLEDADNNRTREFTLEENQ